MREAILGTYAMTLDTARRLMEGVECADCAGAPYPDAKHPAWTLSHLCVASGMAASFLDESGQESPLGGVPEAWAGVSSPGMPITNERSAYASKDELLAELERLHGVVAERFAGASDAFLAREFPSPDYREFWPTVGHAAFYMLAYHEGYHLGQMSQWRRAAGYPSAAQF